MHNRSMEWQDLMAKKSEGEQAPQVPSSKKTRRAIVALAVFALVLTGFLVMPTGCLIYRPGPTVNVLGSQGETVVLEFSSDPDDPTLPVQREMFEGDGELRMVTVSESGGPGNGKVRGAELVQAWFEPGSSILKYSDVYDKGVTAEEVEQASAAQMTSSHSTAAIAAMDYLGIPMESELTVVGVVPGSGAEGAVEEGDVLVSLEDPSGTVHALDRPSAPFTVVKRIAPGSKVLLTVLRNGKEVTVPITTSGPEQGESFEGSKMGVYLDVNTELPIDVTIHLEKVGGPSAGLAFALGIIDELTEGGTTGGESIAATGSLSFAGDVVPIGGVKQKMYGALRDGSKWFLVPADNCDSVVGNEPDGLRVVPVKTLSQAADALSAIAAGDGNGLPVCEAQS